MHRLLPLAVAILLGNASPLTAEPAIDFGREIAPILSSCLRCHGPNKQQGGLRFDAGLAGAEHSDSGESAVVPGKAVESELIRRITSTDEQDRMPPEGDSLSPTQIDALRRWIDAGAEWPSSVTSSVEKTELVVTASDRQHWAYQPLRSPKAPTTPAVNATGSPIDRFLSSALDAHGLKMSPEASSRTLARRIHFDLTGLPPSPEDLKAFETGATKDSAESAAALIDRLLASPHYGERWGRHWLDVAHYADSDGQESDLDRPHAYPYRDFVIQALNDDLPFDTFVRWQIAGDELAPDDPRAVAATGFLTTGPHTVLDVPMEEEKIRSRYDELDDLLSTLGSAMLGLTLACARCHDHKYDPIPTRDYYRLLAAFETGNRTEALLGPREQQRVYREAHDAWKRKVNGRRESLSEFLLQQRAQLEPSLRQEKIEALPLSDDDKASLRVDSESKLAETYREALTIGEEELRQAMSEEDRTKWTELRANLDAASKAEPAELPKALVFVDGTSQPKPAWLFHRADFYDKSTPVALGFLSILSGGRSAEEFWKAARDDRQREDSTYQRAALAHWITDVEAGAGGLLARVIVNRVWQHHFGEGLVRTPNDFGRQGERPTHPDLLEWLAHDFVAHGWRLKRLHRQIMLSAAYRQASTSDERLAARDPDNRLLGRRRPQRLEAEALRDAMLAAAGTLNLDQFGPGFKPPISDEAMVARNLKTPYHATADGPAVRRRSVYMFHKRVVPYPLLQAFDRPDSLRSCGRRDTTTVAPQALAILNDAFVRERANEFATRLEREAGDDMDQQLRRAFWLALGRPPDDSDLKAAREFVEDQRRRPEGGDRSAQAAMADFCQVLFGLNEFLYVD